MNPTNPASPVGASPHTPGVLRFTGYQQINKPKTNTTASPTKRPDPNSPAMPYSHLPGARDALQRSPILRTGYQTIPQNKQTKSGHF